jgi:serine/threonine protein kinase
MPVAATDARNLPKLTKYDLLEEIGHGGMATVYRAHDPRLKRDVAVKVLHRHLLDSTEVAHRFRAEAQAVAKLRHPNTLEVYDVAAVNRCGNSCDAPVPCRRKLLQQSALSCSQRCSTHTAKA